MIVLQHQCYKGAPRRTKGAIGIWRQRNVSCGVSQCYHQGKTNTDSSTNNLQLWGRVMKVLILRARQFRATLWYTWMTLPPSVNKVARVCLQEGEGQLSHPLMNTPSPEFCFHKEMAENASVWTLIKTLLHCHYIIFFCLCTGNDLSKNRCHTPMVEHTSRS